jgi:hypothetical protein
MGRDSRLELVQRSVERVGYGWIYRHFL